MGWGIGESILDACRTAAAEPGVPSQTVPAASWCSWGRGVGTSQDHCEAWAHSRWLSSPDSQQSGLLPTLCNSAAQTQLVTTWFLLWEQVPGSSMGCNVWLWLLDHSASAIQAWHSLQSPTLLPFTFWEPSLTLVVIHAWSCVAQEMNKRMK